MLGRWPAVGGVAGVGRNLAATVGRKGNRGEVTDNRSRRRRGVETSREGEICNIRGMKENQFGRMSNVAITSRILMTQHQLLINKHTTRTRWTHLGTDCHILPRRRLREQTRKTNPSSWIHLRDNTHKWEHDAKPRFSDLLRP